jgi:hypothetical protein
LQALGIQDAGRKRELGGQRPRAWTGGVVHTDQGSTPKFVVKAKWIKLKEFITLVLAANGSIDRKRFESGLGFLVHLASVYDFLRPYLVGFYLAQYQFRSRRDADGWVRTLTGPARVQFEAELDRFESHTHRDYYTDRDDVAPMDTEGGKCWLEEGGKEKDDGTGEKGRGDGPEVIPVTVPVTQLLLRNASTI